MGIPGELATMKLDPQNLCLPKMVELTQERAAVEATVAHLRDAANVLMHDIPTPQDLDPLRRRVADIGTVAEHILKSLAERIAIIEANITASAAQEHRDPWEPIPGFLRHGEESAANCPLVYQMHRAGPVSYLVVVYLQRDTPIMRYGTSVRVGHCLRGEEWERLCLLADACYKEATGFNLEAHDWDRAPLRVATYLVSPPVRA
jgi:hypothetical protein